MPDVHATAVGEADGQPVHRYELSNGRLTVGLLTYGATILAEYEGEGLAHVAERQQDAALPESFGRASLFIDDCPDIAYCIPPCHGETLCQRVGPIPGGPYGTGWSWSKFECLPCRDYGDLGALCNETYPRCEGQCGLA